MSAPASVSGTNARAYTEGTTAGATATNALVANKYHHAILISGWTDAASLVQILDGSTVVWETKVEAGKGFHFSFAELPIVGAIGTAMAGKIVTSTADCAVRFHSVASTNTGAA